MKILFIDTETGGLSQNSALIQLSGIVQIGKNEAEVFNFYVKPFPSSEVTDEALFKRELGKRLKLLKMKRLFFKNLYLS